jgi:hypothetical protein
MKIKRQIPRNAAQIGDEEFDRFDRCRASEPCGPVRGHFRRGRGDLGFAVALQTAR